MVGDSPPLSRYIANKEAPGDSSGLSGPSIDGELNQRLRGADGAVFSHSQLKPPDPTQSAPPGASPLSSKPTTPTKPRRDRHQRRADQSNLLLRTPLSSPTMARPTPRKTRGKTGKQSGKTRMMVTIPAERLPTPRL